VAYAESVIHLGSKRGLGLLRAACATEGWVTAAALVDVRRSTAPGGYGLSKLTQKNQGGRAGAYRALETGETPM
jgi:hypothetical protein